jgi:hypothetical protein
MIAVMAITLIVEVPIDNLIANWTEATLPSDWQEIRARWAAFHTLRTFLLLASVAAAVAAALTTRPFDQSERSADAPRSSVASTARTP